MPRPIALGNGRLHIALDRSLDIRDLYWPYVGLHNHLSGNRVRAGLWIDGTFSWFSDPAWNRSLAYVPNSLTSDVILERSDAGIRVNLNDCVLHSNDILLRRFRIENTRDHRRELRLFLAHDFHIAETDIADTAFYNPFLGALIHFKRDTYLLMSGKSDEGGIFQYAAGISGFGGAEGTWRDAEDGILSMNAVAQGAVDSVFSVRAIAPANGTTELASWICLGHSLNDVAQLQELVLEQDAVDLLGETTRYWIDWSSSSMRLVVDLPEPIPAMFRRSLLTIRTNVDDRGAIIAANDSDIMETARAHYSYMWPRDGALVSWALDRCGYHDLTRRFFEFCAKTLPEDRAAWLHKYSSDGSWGSTWHPWVIDGEVEIPFQEDSTALVLWALDNHIRMTGDLEFLRSVYDSMVSPCADFISSFRDTMTGLPLPSYDLWEERRGTHAYTCGTVYGALLAAASMADALSDNKAVRYRIAAEEVRQGIVTHLWDAQANRFARRLVPKDGGYERDMTLDCALYGLFAFGALRAEDPMVETTMRAVVSRLWVQTDVGGMARYEGDYYFRRSGDLERIPGNPWFICTLWAAQWYIARAKSKAEMTTALDLMHWAARRGMETGILPEQLHPESGEPISVAPLTWSHAEFVSTCLNYKERVKELYG